MGFFKLLYFPAQTGCLHTYIANRWIAISELGRSGLSGMATKVVASKAEQATLRQRRNNSTLLATFSGKRSIVKTCGTVSVV